MRCHVVQAGEASHTVESLFCYSSLLRFISLQQNFLPKMGTRLRAGRAVIARAILLQELIHGLQGLIIAIKNLKILNRRRGLLSEMTRAREIGDSPATGKKNHRQSPSDYRSELSARIEE